jgi:deoxyribodipyrimidine photo-lyase
MHAATSHQRPPTAPAAEVQDQQPLTLLWLRRDLRLTDNPALVAAARSARLLVLYVWEPRQRRWAPGAAGRWWLWHSLSALARTLGRGGSRLWIETGDPAAAVPALAAQLSAERVVWAEGLDLDERADDGAVSAALGAAGVAAECVPSAALLWDQAAVRTRAGQPYSVFTPYWRACLSHGEPPAPLPAPAWLPPAPQAPGGVPLATLRDEAVKEWSSDFGDVWRPGEAGAHQRLDAFLERGLPRYADDRDLPAVEGSSRLSPHLHWGELSGRQLWHAVAGRLAEAGLGLEAATAPAGRNADGGPGLGRSAGAFVRQMGWREFAHHLLRHYPLLPVQPLQAQFAAFPWADDPEGLEAWRRGRTGYPLVDAAMRELWSTGWMHNRSRLVAASFLVKDLLLPWQTGEEWFWDTLVDADLADNAMGWQWVAGCGADAAPYFRIFNPETQRRRYDPDEVYVRRWLPEVVSSPSDYPPPIVDHGEARSRALAAYDAMRSA